MFTGILARDRIQLTMSPMAPPAPAFLFQHGYDVIAYDYRGVGESRPAALRGFAATWLDWGRLDFEAVLRYAAHTLEGRSIDVVAHSIGGFVVGLAPSNHLIRRVDRVLMPGASAVRKHVHSR